MGTVPLSHLVERREPKSNEVEWSISYGVRVAGRSDPAGRCLQWRPSSGPNPGRNCHAHACPHVHPERVGANCASYSDCATISYAASYPGTHYRAAGSAYAGHARDFALADCPQVYSHVPVQPHSTAHGIAYGHGHTAITSTYPHERRLSRPIYTTASDGCAHSLPVAL